MSLNRRKKYFFEKNVALSKYAKTKIRKILKQKKINAANNNNFELPSNMSVSEERQEMSHLQCNVSVLQCESTDYEMHRHFEYESDPEEDFHFECSSSSTNECNSTCNMLDALQERREDDSDYDENSSDGEISNILLKENIKSSSVADLMNEEEFFKSITMNVDWSPAELMLMTLKYYLSTTSSVQSLSNLLKLINRISGKKCLPETRHKIDHLYSNINHVTLHSICYECSEYLGTFEDLNGHINCENCNTNIDVSNPSNLCYFAIIDPSDAVRDYLESHDEYYDYVVGERIHERNHIKDIYDGKLYRGFVQSLNESDRHAYATMVFNTDGAPVFKSSTFSIWPIYGILNELPVQDRLNSSITIGLWFGRNKPEMQVFLHEFVKLLNRLSAVGIPCKIKNRERNIKLFALLASVDTVARAPMNGSMQFNSYFGCDWCMQRGVHEFGSMRYPFLDPPAEERNRVNTIEFAKQSAETGKPVRGINNPSPLLLLKCFDIISGFTPDYMHCMLAGVAQQFTEYLLNMLLPLEIDIADKLMETIKVPHQVGRLTRLLKDRSYWKAREWENWVLYYSVPIFIITLKEKKFLKHWCLLVNALHICLKLDITYAELNEANVMLYQFVSEAQAYYGITAMTYNVHQLLHIVKSVHDWGPSWAHSTFPFEAANHRLLTAVHSAKGVVLQIVRHNNIQRCVKILEHNLYPNGSSILLDYCQNIKGTLAKKTMKLSTITYFGTQKILDCQLIQQLNLPRTIRVFSKAVINHCLFTSAQKINKRSCNFFAQLKDKTFIQIIHFLADKNTKKELIVCNVLKTAACFYSNKVRQIIEIEEQTCIETNLIFLPAVFIQIQERRYIVPVPNCHFY